MEKRKGRRVNYKNVPIPEGHLVPLIIGILLQIFFPIHIFNLHWLSSALGVPMLIAGIFLAAWAVYEVREIDIESSERMITTGPYAFSRNPMYVAWSLIYLGVTFLANSIWLLAFFIPVLLYMHCYVIPTEEKQLMRKFGEQYLKYRSKVRRYI